MAKRPVCPACVEPVTENAVRCRDCGSSYHAGCRAGGCLVPGCGPKRNLTPALAPIGWCWRLARWCATGAALGFAWLWFRSDAWRWKELGVALAVLAAGLFGVVFFIWLGCLLDFRSGATAGRRFGTIGLWLFTTCLAVSVPTSGVPPLSTLLLVAAALSGLGYGAYGIARDRLPTRAALALSAGLLLGSAGLFARLGW